MSLTKASYSMISGAPANVLDFGADPTGATDSTTAIQNALDSGAVMVVVPQGVYAITGVEIKNTSAVEQFVGAGKPEIRLTTGTNRVAITVSKNYVSLSDLAVTSTGSKTDGNATVGIRQSTGVAYTDYTNIRMADFSSRAIQIRQCVYSQFNNLIVYNSNYGLSLEAVSGIPCTTVTINEAYFSGCTRGISGENVAVCTINNPIFEYCGSATNTDGALHIELGLYTLTFPYWEANNRNVVSIDAKFQFVYQYVLPATAANVITYSGVPVGERGATAIQPYGINTPRLNADVITNRNLEIGENLIVPVAGGSVNFDGLTREVITGAATSSVWSTVKALSGQSGAGQSRVSYRYAIYMGQSDLTTGYDTGSILNGVLYSDTGSNPAWLRVNSDNLQVNVTSSSYGLNYGCALTVQNAIA